MSAKKVPTANELIALSGLDKSPDQVLGLDKLAVSKLRTTRLVQWLKNTYRRYVYFRLKDVSSDIKKERTFWTGLNGIFIPFLSFLMYYVVKHATVASGMIAVVLCYCLLHQYGRITKRAKRNCGAEASKTEAGGTIAIAYESPANYFKFWLRNLLLSPFDLFIFRSLIRLSSDFIYHEDDWAGHTTIFYDRQNVFAGVLAGKTVPTQHELVRKHYTDGLKRVEDELIGPNSDWSKSLVDLKDRLEKIERNLSRFDDRIAEAKNADDDTRYIALKNGKARCVSSQRGLIEAIDAIDLLMKRTRTEINKLYKLVDSMGDVYQDAELIKESDALITEAETSIDYARGLREQAYEKITRQLTAVAGVVIGHQLHQDGKIESIDMPRYLEKIERAANSIAKIEDAA